MLVGIMNHQDGDQVDSISLTYLIFHPFLIGRAPCEKCSLAPKMKNIDTDTTSVQELGDLAYRFILVINQQDTLSKSHFSWSLS